jgi:hypothetical protein
MSLTNYHHSNGDGNNTVDVFNEDEDVNQSISPATLARWQRNRPYTKLWSETTSRLFLSRLPWKVKAIYFGLQPILGQSEVVGVLIKDGAPISPKTIGLQLNLTANAVSDALDLLVEFGVMRQHHVDKCYYDRAMVSDELVSMWESARKKSKSERDAWWNSHQILALRKYANPSESVPEGQNSGGNPITQHGGKSVVQEQEQEQSGAKRSEALNIIESNSSTAPACMAVAATTNNGNEYSELTDSEIEAEEVAAQERATRQAEREARQREIDAQIDRNMAEIAAKLEAEREAKRQAAEVERKAAADREAAFLAEVAKHIAFAGALSSFWWWLSLSKSRCDWVLFRPCKMRVSRPSSFPRV